MTLSVSNGPENLRFQAVSKWRFTDSWFLANPSWLTAWAVKTLMTGRGGTVDQSDFVAYHPPQSRVPRSSPLFIRIISLVEKALDPSSHNKPPELTCELKRYEPPRNCSSASSSDNRHEALDKTDEHNPRPLQKPMPNTDFRSSCSPLPSAFHYSSTGWVPYDSTTHNLLRS